MNSKTRCFLCALAVGFAVVASAAPTLAVTKKLMQGAGCQWESNNPQDFYGIYGPYHPDDVVRSLVCPITRSNVTNTNGLTDLEVRLRAIGSQFVECTAYSLRPDLTVVKSVTKSAYGYPSIFFKIDFGATLNASVANGSYAVRCSMPYSMYLVSVLWAEP